MLVNSIKRFLASEDGPTAVEYAVMLALIIVVCLTAIQAVGTNANNKFNAVKNCAHIRFVLSCCAKCGKQLESPLFLFLEDRFTSWPCKKSR